MSDIRFNNWYHQSGTGGVYQDGSGNVGIGSTVPTTQLDVAGTVTVTNDLDVGTAFHVDATNDNVGVGFYSDNTIYKFSVTELSGEAKMRIEALGPNGTANDAVLDLFVVDDGQHFIKAGSIRGVGNGSLTIESDPDDDTWTTDASIVFKQIGAETMRLDSNGNLGIGSTQPTVKLEVSGEATASKFWERNANPDYQTSGVSMDTGRIRATGASSAGAVIGNNNTAGYNTMISFVGGSTSAGYGSIEANSSAGPRFVAPSDRRMKTNIRPAESQFELFKQLQFYNYTMDYPELIEDPICDCLGMIADEVQQVMPELVTGEPNAVDEDGNPEYQTVGYTGLVPHSIAAIKELILKVEELQARLDAAGL